MNPTRLAPDQLAACTDDRKPFHTEPKIVAMRTASYSPRSSGITTRSDRRTSLRDAAATGERQHRSRPTRSFSTALGPSINPAPRCGGLLPSPTSPE